MGVVVYIYLKHSPDFLIHDIYIYIYIIWIHGSNSLSSSVFAEILFLAYLALHRERRMCGQVGPIPRYSESDVYAYQVLKL